MSDNYEFAESLGTHHPGEVSLTVAQAEDRERQGIPLPIGGDPVSVHIKELLAIHGARRMVRATGHTFRDTGGLDEDGVLWNASFHCDDCGLYYSWPVTPGLAANDDPKQAEMLALAAEHTPAVCRATQAAAAIEREKELAAEAAETYDSHQDVAVPVGAANMLITDVVRNELDGYPCPISGDPVVTLRDAIDRGAVTVTKGLPTAVLWARSNPGLAKTHSPIYWPRRSMKSNLAMWPTPSHQALTDSMKALAATQRRLMIGGVLQCHGDNTDARAAS